MRRCRQALLNQLHRRVELFSTRFRLSNVCGLSELFAHSCAETSDNSARTFWQPRAGASDNSNLAKDSPSIGDASPALGYSVLSVAAHQRRSRQFVVRVRQPRVGEGTV